ncbi:MAG: cytochrome c oxidase subunit II [Chloroflexota bacterium]
MNLGKSNNNSAGIPGALIVIIVVLTVLLAIGGFLIAQLTPVIFPDQASAESQQIDELFKVLLGIGGSIFLLVQGALLYSVIRFRKRKGDESDGPTIHGNVTLELIWTAIPSIIVLGLVIYSYQVWTDINEPKDDELIVYAEGVRFAWTFQYDDPRLEQLAEAQGEEAEPVRVNSNVLHTYIGQPVRMVMETQDVIHSFWVPEMRIKQDLLPGRTTEVRFTPIAVEDKTSDDYPLQYRVVCTELCGSGHGNMWAFIYVHENEESYMEFIDQEVERILNPPEDPVIRGMNVLANGPYGCSSCHVLEDERDGITIDWEGITGPALSGIADRAPTRVSGQTAEEYLYISLYDTDSYLVPGYGNLMNPFQFDDPGAPHYMPIEDGKAIVAYLCTVSEDRTLEELEENPICDLDNLDAFAESFVPTN